MTDEINTAEETSRRLAIAEMQVERSKVVMESLAGFCHALGQPATVLLSSIELLRMPETDEETRKAFPHDFALAVSVRLNDRLTLKMTGENWESQEKVENVVNVEQTKDFPGWNAWLEMNKQGLDYTISINREKNVITLSAENAGVVINSTTTILDGNDDIYVALTGDQCAITNIRTQML